MNSLCQLAQDWRGTIPTGGAMAEQKIDGWRALYFPGIDGITRLWMRNGHVIEGVGHIMHRLALMERLAGCQMMFDGEFQVDGTLAATKEWCERRWKFGGEAGVLHLFDAMPLSDWRKGGCPIPAYQRKARLVELWQAVEDDDDARWEWRAGSRGRDETGPTPVQIVPDEWVWTARDAIEAACRVWAAGGEGVMLKHPDAPYQRRRTAHWLKLKMENVNKWKMAA